MEGENILKNLRITQRFEAKGKKEVSNRGPNQDKEEASVLTHSAEGREK